MWKMFKNKSFCRKVVIKKRYNFHIDHNVLKLSLVFYKRSINATYFIFNTENRKVNFNKNFIGNRIYLRDHGQRNWIRNADKAWSMSALWKPMEMVVRKFIMENQMVRVARDVICLWRVNRIYERNLYRVRKKFWMYILMDTDACP